MCVYDRVSCMRGWVLPFRRWAPCFSDRLKLAVPLVALLPVSVVEGIRCVGGAGGGGLVRRIDSCWQ